MYDEHTIINGLKGILQNYFTGLVRVIFTLPYEVLTRHKFGERGLPWLAWPITTAIWYHVIPTVEIDRSSADDERAHVAAAIFVVIFTALFIYQKWEIRLRRVKGIQWHSFSPGEPWSFLGPNNDLGNYVILPLVGVAYGFAYIYLTPAVTKMMLTAALCYMGIRWYQSRVWRNRILDAQDAQIEAMWFSTAYADAQAKPNSGFTVPNVVYPAERQNLGYDVNHVLLANNPKLREMMENLEKRKQTTPPPLTTNRHS